MGLHSSMGRREWEFGKKLISLYTLNNPFLTAHHSQCPFDPRDKVSKLDFYFNSGHGLPIGVRVMFSPWCRTLAWSLPNTQNQTWHQYCAPPCTHSSTMLPSLVFLNQAHPIPRENNNNKETWILDMHAKHIFTPKLSLNLLKANVLYKLPLLLPSS